MPKLLAPPFRPRRPSSFARYGILAILVIAGFFLLKRNPVGLIGYHRPMPQTLPGQDGAHPDEPFFPPPVKKPTMEAGSSYQIAADEAESDPRTKPSTDDTPQINQRPPQVQPDVPDVTIPANHRPPQIRPNVLGDSKTGTQNAPPSEKRAHPVDKLIEDANIHFSKLLKKETVTLEDAAQAYRKRRGRHPPPGFDKWFEFASRNGAIIIEEFWDQIYTDLEPFWGLDPAIIRKESWDFEMVINIRDGVASTGSDWFWTQIWLDMIASIQHLLPDMDLALNAMDEPRVVVPWEDIDAYVHKASKTHKLIDPRKVSSKFQKLPKPGQGDLEVKTREKIWENTSPYWKLVRRGCPPDSLARTVPLEETFDSPPVIDHSMADPHSYQGFVSNYSLSSEVCHQPDLQGLEGVFIAPLSTSTTDTLWPMFGGSKLHVNNEIILPAPMYWNNEERFTGGDEHGLPWEAKGDCAIWRGVATGGKNRADNWKRFQRHRFVSMNNGTHIARGLTGERSPVNFALPDKKYNLMAAKWNDIPGWVDSWQDVAFVDLNCDTPEEMGHCYYTDQEYEIALGLRMVEQFACKFLPDIDGNSFSGRYLGFLRSTSVPVKAALWKEWHDSRLIAWKHFVPMDSRFGEWYGLMEYFMGYRNEGDHDQEAARIASDGQEWAQKVLRREDMQIYTLRLLLEYARVLDEEREGLGWADDALANPTIAEVWSEWW